MHPIHQSRIKIARKMIRRLAMSCFDKIIERLENIGSDYETLERE